MTEQDRKALEELLANFGKEVFTVFENCAKAGMTETPYQIGRCALVIAAERFFPEHKAEYRKLLKAVRFLA